jgi:hypothetical protein
MHAHCFPWTRASLHYISLRADSNYEKRGVLRPAPFIRGGIRQCLETMNSCARDRMNSKIFGSEILCYCSDVIQAKLKSSKHHYSANPWLASQT